MPDTGVSQHSRRNRERVDRGGTAAVSVSDTDCGGSGEFRFESVVDTEPRLAGGGMGQPGHRWGLGFNELDGFDSLVPVDGARNS